MGNNGQYEHKEVGVVNIMMKTMIGNESKEKARLIGHMSSVVNDLAWIPQHNQVEIFGQLGAARYGEKPCQAKEIKAMDIHRDYSKPSFTFSTKWIEPADLRHVRRKEEITTYT